MEAVVQATALKIAHVLCAECRHGNTKEAGRTSYYSRRPFASHIVKAQRRACGERCLTFQSCFYNWRLRLEHCITPVLVCCCCWLYGFWCGGGWRNSKSKVGALSTSNNRQNTPSLPEVKEPTLEPQYRKNGGFDFYFG